MTYKRNYSEGGLLLPFSPPPPCLWLALHWLVFQKRGGRKDVEYLSCPY